MKRLLIVVPIALSLAACQSYRPVPWTFKDQATGQTRTATVTQGLVRADLKRQVVNACIDGLDEINKQANASQLVGKAPGGYEWYAANPNARVYGPQDCQGLIITGMDIANNAVKEVRGVIGGVVNALPWIAVAKLGKYGFKAAGTKTSLETREGNIEYTTDSIRDTYGSELNSESIVDQSIDQSGSESGIEYFPSSPTQSTSTTTFPDLIPPDPEGVE